MPSQQRVGVVSGTVLMHVVLRDISGGSSKIAEVGLEGLGIMVSVSRSA